MSRLKYLDYSEEYYVNVPLKFYALKDKEISFDNDLDNMIGYKIGIVSDYSYGKEFDDYMKNNILEVDETGTALENIEKLMSGRIDVIAESKYVAYDIFKKQGYLDRVKEIDGTIIDITAYFGYPKVLKHQTFIEKFDEALRGLRVDGTQDRIYEEYFGE